ncbi:MAG: hypothetical protein ACR2OB_14355 [Solirubrobacteraceae bacterium]
MAQSRRVFSGLLGVYLPIAIVVFVLVLLALAFALVRYRAAPGRQVSGRDDAPRSELAYVLGITATVIVLVILTFRGESHVDALAASPALKITATGSDWRWRFDYPGLGVTELGHGQQPTPLYVPADRTIEFDLSSLDVLHAFYIPYERFQRAAIPKVVNRFDLVFPTAGVQTDGLCNEFCGVGHTQMRFAVHVLSAQQFAAWVNRRRSRGGTE